MYISRAAAGPPETSLSTAPTRTRSSEGGRPSRDRELERAGGEDRLAVAGGGGDGGFLQKPPGRFAGTSMLRSRSLREGFVVASDASSRGAARGIALALGGRGGGDECRGCDHARQGGVAAVVFDRRGFREDFGRERVRVVVELREVSVGCGVRRRDIARSGLASDGIATRERVTLGWARRGEKRSDARGERTRAERGRGGGNRRKRKFPRSVARFSVVGARAMGCA